ncbi:MAG TPA: hypothetical protein DDW90_11235 [Cyanobacteria bacterium UBA9971]|nr:hypothetical protein [Cyanobacteria bacterium UBA9971]
MTNKTVSYEKAIVALTSQGKFYINLGLDRVKNLLDLYDNPQDKIKCIHVAGTNGKGSTCAMLASVLTHAGYKTGLYTSPHLVDYTERVKINGKDISKEDFADFIFNIIQTAEQNNIHATEFEILTVLAFILFEREKVDFAVIETGLGGRLDATNVIKKPLLSIITTIDSDHVDRLGETIEKIAFEKAGIIKPNVPVIASKDNKGIEVIKEKALKVGSALILVEDADTPYELNLQGVWQKKNLSLVLKAIDLLREQGIEIPEEAVKKGLQNVSWPARFQYIKEMNLILDGAHNPNAARLLSESLDLYYSDKERIWIYSSISTKNYEEVMEILFRHGDIVILTQSNSGAAVSPEILKAKLIQKHMPCKIYTTENIKESINIYFELITNKNIGIMAGSLYTAGDFLSQYKI